ncbi:MAG: cob(I)yrinic acid a,c-diamide adenosyltransferase [Patescibacteria group bacterium]
MPNTLFFTRNGDDGKSVIGKKNIPKSDSLFALLGALDELNSWIGFCVACDKEKSAHTIDVEKILFRLQEMLFIAQAEIGAIGFGTKNPTIAIAEHHIREIEKIIFDIDAVVPPIKHFVLPGGTMCAASLDIARVVARKTERIAVKFSKKKKISPEFLQFLNRFSSILFALARYINFISGKKEARPSYQ